MVFERLKERLRQCGEKGTQSSAYVSGLVYCVMSASMVLLNKYALSSFHFTSPNTLLLAQCMTAVLMVKAGQVFGFWNVQALRWDLVKIWLPVNVIFVMMLATGIWSLQLMGVAMVTIMKNLTNLLTICGDYALYNRRYNAYVWVSLFLISASAVVGAHTDRGFSAWGYTAQLLNCAFTAAYSLVLRGVMDKVSAILGQKMDTQSQVYYNNILSLPFVMLLIVGFGEHAGLASDLALRSPTFLFVAAVSCVIGFLISYAALWFLSTTTPTTYSLVGSLNKIPVAVIGIVAFHAPTTPTNLASIAVGLLAGIMFSRAKQLKGPS